MKYLINILFLVSILFTILSQVPQILDLNLSIYFQLMWVVLLVFLLFIKSIYLSKQIVMLLILVLLTIFYSFFMELFTYKNYLNSPHYINITKSFFIVALSFYAAQYITEDKFKIALLYISLIGGSILAIAVYKHSFETGFDITAAKYAYAAKNSVSQIILSCMIIVLFLSNFKNNLMKIFSLIFLFFSLYLIFILKSRATILALVFVAGILLLQSNNRKLQYGIILFLIITTITLVLNTELFNIIYNNIILGSRSGDLNNISSGRFELYEKFPALFSENILFGQGNLFIESFPLSILLEYGIIGGMSIFLFVLAPILFFKRKLEFLNPLHLVFLLLILIFYFNGIFEYEAPLGPGSKNFMLWVIFGYLLQKQTIKNEKA